MQFAKEDIAKFIEIVTESKDVEIQHIKKEIVHYKHTGSGRKHIKVNLHSLAVSALALLSKKHGIIIKINNGISIFKLGKFRFEASVKEWTNSVIFITLLKLK